MGNKNFLSTNWGDFEAWIKEKVGGEISWKVKPRDTKVNRMKVAMSILKTLDQMGGKFPPWGNTFLNLEKKGKNSAPSHGPMEGLAKSREATNS